MFFRTLAAATLLSCAACAPTSSAPLPSPQHTVQQKPPSEPTLPAVLVEPTAPQGWEIKDTGPISGRIAVDGQGTITELESVTLTRPGKVAKL